MAGDKKDQKNNIRRSPDYRSSQRTWNNENYRRRVATASTNTRVLTPPKKSTYFYDNTPSALHARQKKEFDKRLSKLKMAMKRNKRYIRVKRRLTTFLVVSVSLILVFSLVYKFLFVTKNIIIEGNTKYSDEEIIAACGIDENTNLFSFSSRIVGERLKFYCPAVAESVFDRSIPNSVSITVTEEEPVYYADIYGEGYALTESLRILGKVSESESKALIKLKVSCVKRAVAGERIVLSEDRAQRYLENTIELLNLSPLKNRITMIDLRNDFDAVMAADDLYRLDFGTQEDLDVKIRLAHAILNDDLFDSGNKAYIDLRETSKTSVVIDNQLTFD